MTVLRLLGIAESERKLFLSYRRAESEALAIQLRTALSQRFYDVFLDRFSVPPGADFQRRIDIELADKAFVLLLESQSAVGSEWVQHEVAYALSHRIAVLALGMPGVQVEDQFEVVDDAFRHKLRDADLNTEGQLTDGALSSVIQLVERTYSRQARRRQLQLLGSVHDFLRDAGYDRFPLDEWAVGGLKGDHGVVALVTGHAPTPRNLRRADALQASWSEDRGISVDSTMVIHDSADRDDESRDLLDWIVGGRRLGVVPIGDLPNAL